MNTDEWNKLIRNNFDFLFEKHGFEMTSSDYYPEHFGIRITNLESNDYKIKFELDRGTKLLTYICPKHSPSIQHYLQTIVAYINNEQLPWPSEIENDNVEDEKILEQIEYSAKVFREYSEQIFFIFNEENANKTEENIGEFIMNNL